MGELQIGWWLQSPSSSKIRSHWQPALAGSGAASTNAMMIARSVVGMVELLLSLQVTLRIARSDSFGGRMCYREENGLLCVNFPPAQVRATVPRLPEMSAQFNPDVNECDALDFFADDAQTKTIGIYLEDVRDGNRFIESAKKAARRKPVLVLKGGRTRQGARATASHTASLAVDDAVFDGALRQAGVLRMDGVADMLATLMGFEWMPLPRGNGIAVATFSGAQAIMSIDAAMGEGLGMAEFSPQTNERLSRVISFPSKMQNPIDLFPDMMTHGFQKTSCEILKALLDDDGVQGIVFIGFAMLGEDMFRPMAEVIRENPIKPVFVSLLGGREDMAAAEDFLRKEGIPVVPFPETAIEVFARMWRYVQMSRLR